MSMVRVWWLLRKTIFKQSTSAVSNVITNVAASKTSSPSESLFREFRGGALPTHYKYQHHIGVRSAAERVVTYCEKFLRVKESFNCFSTKTVKIKKKPIIEDEEPISNKFEYVDSDILFNKASNMKPWDSKNGYNASVDLENKNSSKDCSKQKNLSSVKKINSSKSSLVINNKEDHSDVQKTHLHMDKNNSNSVDSQKEPKHPNVPSPPQPRLRRLASLNAEAKVNIFFEKEEPKCYKRIKIEIPTRFTRFRPRQDFNETSTVSASEGDKDIPVNQNKSENETKVSCESKLENKVVSVSTANLKQKIYKRHILDKKEKSNKEHRRRRVRDWFAPRHKKTQKKLLTNSKFSKDNVPKLIKKAKQQSENKTKIIIENLPEEPRSSKRIASLNAQAIIAVTNTPERIMSPRTRIIKKARPKLLKKLKEDKKIYDEVIVLEDSPKKREIDPDIYEFVDEIEKPYDSAPSSRLYDIKEKHKKFIGQSFTPYTPSPPQTHLASSPHLMGSIPYTGHTTHIPTLYPYNGAIIPSAHCQTLTLSGVGSISSLPLGIHRHYGSAFSVPHYNHTSHLSYVHENNLNGEQKRDQN